MCVIYFHVNYTHVHHIGDQAPEILNNFFCIWILGILCLGRVTFGDFAIFAPSSFGHLCNEKDLQVPQS